MRTFGTEKNYAVWDDQITEILLIDRTTGNRFPINPDKVMPRYMKAAMEQDTRTKEGGEVFTPYDIVKKMNNTHTANKGCLDGRSIGVYRFLW